MFTRTSSGCFTTSNPATVATPWVGESTVERIRIIVVLPEPLGPSSPKTSPIGTRSVTSSRARKSSSPNVRTMLVASTAY